MFQMKLSPFVDHTTAARLSPIGLVRASGGGGGADDDESVKDAVLRELVALDVNSTTPLAALAVIQKWQRQLAAVER
jgi:hypothetical protein